MASHCNILAGESNEQRSLAGYSPWSRKELDMTEQLTNELTISLLVIYPKKTKTLIQEDRCTKMFIVTLFTIGHI